MEKKYLQLVRISLFVIYFWFGLLKIIGVSPADPVVNELLKKTLSFWPAESFIPLFGLFECLIALGFLMPKFTKYVVIIAAGHMFTTITTLVLLPEITWQSFLVPTFAGQYVLKNILILVDLYILWVNRKTK